MLRTLKRLIPAAIVLLWLVMMGGLLYREVALPRMYRGLTSKRVFTPQNLWFGLYFGEDQRVGYVHLRTAPEERDGDKGFTLAVFARLAFPILGQDVRFQLSGHAWQSALHGLREFDFDFGSGDHEMRIKGITREGVIEATLHTAGEKIPFKLPVGREVLLAGGLGLDTISLPLLEPNEFAYVDTFDPTTMSVGRARIEALRRETIEVAGESIEALVVATTIGGITTRAWISPDEEVLRAETPLGLIIKRISSEEAFADYPTDQSADMVRALSVIVTGPAPDPDADRLRLRIRGVDDALLPPDEPRQRRDGEDWLLMRQGVAEDRPPEPQASSELEEHLASDLFIQADHPRIRQAAEEIVADAKDPWTKAVRIHDWLFENIEKKHVLSVPSALDVLDARTGDCNEHSVLFAALARAVNIPTRIAIGLGWSRQMQAFGYHAWPEVHVGQWVAMDPTFGEQVAGPTHIKLFTGGIDQWPRLLSYVGAIEIEILE